MLPISTTLQKLASDILRTAPPEQAPLLGWPMACGTAVAERTRAISFADGILTIAAADKAWCSQLNGFSDSYLQSLNRISPVKISQLRFIIDTDKAG